MLTLFGCGPDLPQDLVSEYSKLPDYIDYNFHIKPILSDRCFACHGPDELARKADLRLDIEQEAKAKLSNGHFALVDGNPGKSTLYDRIISSENDYLMPPPESKLRLSNRDKAMLIKWIEQGAEYKPHWSFISPVKATVPENNGSGWQADNEIDYFIQEKL
ncbi:MAG: hypothetical protein KDC80_26085, partial [Saprospiraceae bacterium]|nr:hypothetical protein [Saprospiraceae bacterium]